MNWQSIDARTALRVGIDLFVSGIPTGTEIITTQRDGARKGACKV